MVLVVGFSDQRVFERARIDGSVFGFSFPFFGLGWWDEFGLTLQAEIKLSNGISKADCPFVMARVCNKVADSVHEIIYSTKRREC